MCPELMRVNCKVWPLANPHPAFPTERFHWAPLLNIKLTHQHSPPTKWLECFVDSGSPSCMFHASLCRPLGIERLEDGIEDTLGGIIGGPTAPMYYHKVKLLVGSEQVTTMAAFSWDLSVAGILGRRGFFDNFVVTFDATGVPPVLELNRIYRT